MKVRVHKQLMAVIAGFRATPGTPGADMELRRRQQIKTLISIVLTAMAVLTGSVIAQEYGFPVVDTGQNVYYGDTSEITSPQEGEAFYGQDAQYDEAEFRGHYTELKGQTQLANN